MNLTIDRDDIQCFLDTLPPDPERDRRTNVLRASAEAFTATLARKQHLQEHLEQIAAALVDATGKDRERLLAERSTLTSELTSLPLTVRIVAARFAEALVSWGAYVHREVMRVYNDAADQIEAHATERRELIAKLTRLENSTRFSDKAAEVKGDYDALQATLRPAHQRREQARYVAAAIEGELRQRFWGDIRAATVDQRFIDRFVAGITKQAA